MSEVEEKRELHIGQEMDDAEIDSVIEYAKWMSKEAGAPVVVTGRGGEGVPSQRIDRAMDRAARDAWSTRTGEMGDYEDYEGDGWKVKIERRQRHRDRTEG